MPADDRSRVTPQQFWDVVVKQLGHASKPIACGAGEALGMGLIVAKKKNERKVRQMFINIKIHSNL